MSNVEEDEVHPNTQAVAAALAWAGAAGQVQEMEASTRTAADAAAALGCPVGAIANSLVFLVAE
jgi:prolyl-tRNA editing enzyme YbaK/EbsC (Cys-tRNA(Pro) deacylase)